VAVLAFGEQAADGLVAALGSPSQHVRHACALGIGQLKVRRSLLALIKQIETEPTPSWAEMARALGDFGSAALRPVSRSIQSSERRERLMVGLAHLANHGSVEEVKTLETDPDPTVALAARQAMARCSRMEWDDQAVRNQQQLRDNSPETRFSQVFYAELARVPG
jgi:HEAT repeat protein